MSGGVQRYARRMWSGDAGLPGSLVRFLLLPVEWLWRMVTAVRNRHWDRVGGRSVDGAAVVSVGNLAVGGTGKTPFASWVARTLRSLDGDAAIVLRGYGHDEVRLHRRWTPELPVIADVDRVRAVREAVNRGARSIVVDDGFQHRRLSRALDLVLLAVEDPFPAPVLPRGPYREPVEALRRAHAIVLTRKIAGREEAEERAALVRARVPETPVVAGVCLSGGQLRPLLGAGDREATRREIAPPASDHGVLVLTAVAHPEIVRVGVELMIPAPVDLMAFGDHHEFTPEDLARANRRADGHPIIMTEKDAVKLPTDGGGLENAWVLEQTLSFDWGEEAVVGLLRDVLERAPVRRGTGGRA